MGDEAKKALEAAKANAGQAGEAGKLLLVGQIPGINASTNQLLGRQQGQVLNPNMELLV
jgi:hypothetical protein